MTAKENELKTQSIDWNQYLVNRIKNVTNENISGTITILDKPLEPHEILLVAEFITAIAKAKFTKYTSWYSIDELYKIANDVMERLGY